MIVQTNLGSTQYLCEHQHRLGVAIIHIQNALELFAAPIGDAVGARQWRNLDNPWLDLGFGISRLQIIDKGTEGNLRCLCVITQHTIEQG